MKRFYGIGTGFKPILKKNTWKQRYFYTLFEFSEELRVVLIEENLTRKRRNTPLLEKSILTTMVDRLHDINGISQKCNGKRTIKGNASDGT